MWAEWFKPENLKWLLTTAAIPLTLAVLSQQYQCAQTERQTNEARLRLYTELLSKREEADTGVRRGIFDKVLETYLKPEGKELQAKLVALELLALNFNDSLDLSPLFWQLSRQVQQTRDDDKSQAQLERIADGIKDRQISVLESVGAKVDAAIQFGDKSTKWLIKKKLNFPDPDPLAPKGQSLERSFTVEVIDHDTARRRFLFRVMLEKNEMDDRGKGGEYLFWVDLFDFPLVNYVRMSKSERFSVVLKRYGEDYADITLIYFPSLRSGVKDKPFLDEVISDLLRRDK